MMNPSQYMSPMETGFGYVPVSEDMIKDSLHRKYTIQEFMRQFNDKCRPKFNPDWFERDDDKIIDGMQKVIKSCERDKYFLLKILSFRVVKDYSEIKKILHNRLENTTKGGKKVENVYDYINLRDSDIMLLVVRYFIKLNIPKEKIRIDNKTGREETTEGELETLICLPRYVDKYYFRLQGNYYYPNYQIVDGSTYNKNGDKLSTVTLKTLFMPIRVYREEVVFEDCISKKHIPGTLYSSHIFTKKVDCMKYILGKYGLYGAMEMLQIHNMYISNNTTMDPNIYYNFKCKDKVTIISVPRILFDQDDMIQSFVATLCKNIHKYDHDWNFIFNPRFWNRSLGKDFSSNTDKGISVLDSLESIYDLITRESIRLPMSEKVDVYHILRWLMREFKYLKMKDNLDIATKKARLADEYIPALYATRISKSIYRISDKGVNVKFKDVVRAINTDPNVIIKMIGKSNLISYVDLVNDNDAELALSYTYKGISGVGENSSKSVSVKYRRVHASHLGRVDMDASSASDPGLSGIICPMADKVGDSFTDYDEPNTWTDCYNEIHNQYQSLCGMIDAIELKKHLGLSYDYVKEDLVRESIENYNRILPAIIDVSGNEDFSVPSTIGTNIKSDAYIKTDDKSSDDEDDDEEEDIIEEEE